MKTKIFLLIFAISVIVFCLCSFTVEEHSLIKESYNADALELYGEYEFSNYITMEGIVLNTPYSFNNTALYDDSTRAGTWVFNPAAGIINDTLYNEKVYDVSLGGWVGKMSSRKLNFTTSFGSTPLVVFLYNNSIEESFINGQIFYYRELIDEWLPSLYFSALGTWEINGSFIVENTFFNRLRVNSGVISLYNTEKNISFVIYRQEEGALFNGGLYFGNAFTTHYFDSFFRSGFTGFDSVEVYGSYYFNESLTLPESREALYYSRGFNEGTYRFFSGSQPYEFSLMFTGFSGPVLDGEMVYSIDGGWVDDSYRLVDFKGGWYMTQSQYDFLTSNSISLGSDGDYYYQLGFNSGYSQGKEEGYLEGFNAGTNSASPFADFFINLFTAPARILNNLVLFEIPEAGVTVTLWSVLTTCIMLCILTWILKLVAGG